MHYGEIDEKNKETHIHTLHIVHKQIGMMEDDRARERIENE